MNTVDPDYQGAGSSQRQMPNVWQRENGQNRQWEKKPWDGQKGAWDANKPNYTYNVMLDQPCKFHMLTPDRPANHKTRDCAWYQRIKAEEKGEKEEMPPPPPPPLTGANAVAIVAQPRQNENRGQQGVTKSRTKTQDYLAQINTDPRMQAMWCLPLNQRTGRAEPGEKWK